MQDQPGGLVLSEVGGWALLRLMENDPKSHINTHVWARAGMWEGEKIHGKDREEKCPIPAAILLLYQRWIQDAEFFAVLTKCYSLFLALISLLHYFPSIYSGVAAMEEKSILTWK